MTLSPEHCMLIKLAIYVQHYVHTETGRLLCTVWDLVRLCLDQVTKIKMTKNSDFFYSTRALKNHVRPCLDAKSFGCNVLWHFRLYLVIIVPSWVN